ncbi:hypothetical protein HFO65_15720 [Rhizobium laguerreae]|uniref:hypothetical protein n=1 Tax=Rhizobium laguerreae TaxID=1076926 RepID=UPI001C917B2A|nr:hypothetical protein [Rhizobium laguerreae]MBY3162082.1 hypothetical protein [Rhizobium laguerreae]
MQQKERQHFKAQFRTRSGYKIRASFDRKQDGTWKIFSIGAVDGITSLLPFEILGLVYEEPFQSLDDAKWAVKSA